MKRRIEANADKTTPEKLLNLANFHKLPAFINDSSFARFRSFSGVVLSAFASIRLFISPKNKG